MNVKIKWLARIFVGMSWGSWLHCDEKPYFGGLGNPANAFLFGLSGHSWENRQAFHLLLIGTMCVWLKILCGGRQRDSFFREIFLSRRKIREEFFRKFIQVRACCGKETATQHHCQDNSSNNACRRIHKRPPTAHTRALNVLRCMYYLDFVIKCSWVIGTTNSTTDQKRIALCYISM